jgi:tRNA-2-methylthio-N6-dimethylallyladenosine synthase
VRQGAEERTYGQLGRLKKLKQQRRGDLKIAMMGCMVGMRTTELEKRFPFVDVFARPQAFDDILIALGADPGDLGGEFWPETVGEPGGPTAFVPVVHGCDKFCTYCIVPLRRGRERSRPVSEVEFEVAQLARRGVREVTLLGQTVEAYGHDLDERPDLGDLMRAIHDLPGLERIRFLTSYPPDMTDRIIDAVAALPKVCEWFSLPVQSGHDEILDAMRRGYTVAQFRERVARVRSVMPNVGIMTDVIVGFPGETDAHFRATVDLLEELRFDKVHVAAYSPRPGTYAHRRMPDDVPDAVKEERLHEIERVQERVAAEINAVLVGRTEPVLVEGHGEKDGRPFGRTRTGKLVHLTGRAHAGDLVDARITHATAWSLQAEPHG